MYTDLQKEMVIKAKHKLEKEHNFPYRVYPQDIVAELNHAKNSRFAYDYYRGVHCTVKQVKEILEALS